MFERVAVGRFYSWLRLESSHSEADPMLLDVNDLKVSFHSRDGVNEAVKGISFHLEEGKTLAIVGESGSGKSVTSMALTKLLPPEPLCRVSGKATLDGKNLLICQRRRCGRLEARRSLTFFRSQGRP